MPWRERAATVAHPRSRGENRVGWGPLRGREWLIPAHAGKTSHTRRRARPRRAHPRSRGENQVQVLKAHFGDGSSPLTRGKRARRNTLKTGTGLIPAHAGKTNGFLYRAVGRRAHPRSRGENCRFLSGPVSSWGSSPLTRGKPDRAHGRGRGAGLIPAHAGKTAPARPRRSHGRAHPRSRGENYEAHALAIQTGGSSPLTRGKLTSGVGVVMRGGLIPAHAGKTVSSPTPLPTAWAHPRSRGENTPVGTPPPWVQGSSPLTRGKRARPLQRRNTIGLIPAHAGKTPPGLPPARRVWAHPRSRGENAMAEGQISAEEGSSPLTRGKRNRDGRVISLRGLIPAHAGKTKTGLANRKLHRAHPRSRGENIITDANPLSRHGSSPLTRGKQAAGENLRQVKGLIPAHAGKTPAHRAVGHDCGAHPRSRGENDQLHRRRGLRMGSSPLTRGKRACHVTRT